METKCRIQLLEIAGEAYGKTTDIGLAIVESGGKFGLTNEEAFRDEQRKETHYCVETVIECIYDNIFELCTSHFILIQNGRFGLLRIRDSGLVHAHELLLDEITSCEYDYISLHGAILLYGEGKVRFFNQRTGFLSGYYDYLRALDDSHLMGYSEEKTVFVDLLSDTILIEA